MLRARKAAIVLAATLGLGPVSAIEANAVDIINEDARQYLVTIVATEGEMDMVIDGQANLYDVCARCVIRIDGVGDVKADQDATTVVIKDRKAVIEL